MYFKIDFRSGKFGTFNFVRAISIKIVVIFVVILREILRLKVTFKRFFLKHTIINILLEFIFFRKWKT